MKRNVQILLLFACMGPLLVRAEEETMEERKRRITRKYLRERMDITYSEEVVPGENVETDDVLASEKFKQTEVDLERQEPGAALPPPMRPPAPRTENRNWLLSETEEPTDPYADPFARKESKDEPKKDDWSAWGTEREPSPYLGTERESRFNWGGYDSSSGEQSGGYDSLRPGGMFNPRTSFSEDMQSGYPQQGGQTFGSPPEGQDQSRGQSFNSIFNQSRIQSQVPGEAETSVNPLFNSELQPRPGNYTPYKSPFQTQREQRQEQRGGYTPYKSPYQTQREQQQKQWGGYSEPKQEYQRQDTFQQWKQRNPAQFNPMSDDAFIQEKMPKTRR